MTKQTIFNLVIAISLAANVGFTYVIFTKGQDYASQYEAAKEQIEAAKDAPFVLPGKGIEAYDMSEPQAALESSKQMLADLDLRAMYDIAKKVVVEEDDDSSPSVKFYTSDNAAAIVVKTHVVKSPSKNDNKGKVIAFVKYRVDGADSHDILEFNKFGNIYFPGGNRYYIGYDKEKLTDEDKYLEKVIKKWKTEGKL